MAEVSVNRQQQAGRRKAPRTAFKPGQSGNPSGRPKAVRGLRAEIERRFGANGEQLVEELAVLVRCQNVRVRLDAIALLLAYAAGKPAQTIDLGQNPDREPIQLVIVRNGVH